MEDRRDGKTGGLLEVEVLNYPPPTIGFSKAPIPSVIMEAGPDAVRCFIEFFPGNIRNIVTVRRIRRDGGK